MINNYDNIDEFKKIMCNYYNKFLDIALKIKKINDNNLKLNLSSNKGLTRIYKIFEIYIK